MVTGASERFWSVGCTITSIRNRRPQGKVQDTVIGNGATHGNDGAFDGQRGGGFSEGQPHPGKKADPVRTATWYDGWPGVQNLVGQSGGIHRGGIMRKPVLRSGK